MVHGNAQELLDHRCHAWCGPSIGGESKLAGTAIQPREHQLDLLGIERCPTTTAWLGLQTRFSAIAKAFSPASDAASADAKKVGDKLLAPSLGERNIASRRNCSDPCAVRGNVVMDVIIQDGRKRGHYFSDSQ